MALTDRQKEIKGLQREGLKPAEIGERLGISANAVYQQLARMRKGGGAGKSTGTKGSAPKRTATKAGRTPAKAAPKPSAPRRAAPRPAPVVEPPKPLTPLQAIRERRSTIEADLKRTADDLAAAEKALVTAREAHEKAAAKHTEELRNLDLAERAVKGEIPKVAPARQRQAPKRNGSAPKTEDAPAPEPAKSGDQTIAEAAASGAAEAQTDVPSSQGEREASQDEFDSMVPPVEPEPATA